MNLNVVAHTATKALIGTASAMPILKKISIIGILLPAPDRPPAFERVIKIIIKMVPMICSVVHRLILVLLKAEADGAAVVVLDELVLLLAAVVLFDAV